MITAKNTDVLQCYAPTDSISGIRYPSLKRLSSVLISSMVVAFAIAALTFSTSSFDIKRPAFTVDAAGLGSSIVVVLVDCFETVVDSVVANAVGRLSAVRNSDLAV